MTKSIVALLLIILVASCSHRVEAEAEIRSEEEIRLERACRIDSTTFVPDSIEYRDSLDDLTAEAKDQRGRFSLITFPKTMWRS